MPKTIDDIQTANEWRNTETGERFLLHQSKYMIIFVSTNSLKALANSKRWQSDGSFDTAVPGFKQLYLIEALYKHEIMYRKMINEFKEAALQIRLELRPEII